MAIHLEREKKMFDKKILAGPWQGNRTLPDCFLLEIIHMPKRYFGEASFASLYKLL